MRAQGTSLSNNQIFGVVNCAITRKLVPYMTNAVYLVLGASNIQATSGAWLYHLGCQHPSYVLLPVILAALSWEQDGF